MTLNSSGPISLAGTTAGVSIEVELGGGGTTQISLNDTNVRTLAGVASGAITMPTNFYGKSNASYFISMLQVSSASVIINNLAGATFDSSGNIVIGLGGGNNYSSTFISLSPTGSVNWAYQYAASATPNFAISYRTDIAPSNFLGTDGTYIYAGGGAQGVTYGSYFKVNPSTGSVVLSGTMISSSNLPLSAYGFYVDSSGNTYFGTSYQYYNGTCVFYGPAFNVVNSSGSITTTYAINGGYTGQVNSLFYNSSNGYTYAAIMIGNYASYGIFNGSTVVGIYNIYNAGGFINPTTIKLDSSQNIYTGGIFANNSMAIVKINSSNSVQWVSGTTSGYAIQEGYTQSLIDSSANIYYTHNSYQSGGPYIWYIVKLNSSGTILWQRSIKFTAGVYQGQYNFNNGYQNMQIALDSSQQFLCVAINYNDVSFDNRVAVLKLPVDGSKTGTYTITDTVSSTNTLTFTYAASSMSTYTRSGVSTTSASYSSASPATYTSRSVTSSAPTYVYYHQSI